MVKKIATIKRLEDILFAKRREAPGCAAASILFNLAARRTLEYEAPHSCDGIGGGYKGDTDTPEQYIPAKGYPGRDWEACITMNRTWGFKSYDHDFKSTKTFLRNLIDIASKAAIIC